MTKLLVGTGEDLTRGIHALDVAKARQGEETLSQRLQEFDLSLFTVEMCVEKARRQAGDGNDEVSYEAMLRDMFTMNDVATKNDLIACQVALLPLLEEHTTQIDQVERKADSLLQYLRSASKQQQSQLRQSESTPLHMMNFTGFGGGSGGDVGVASCGRQTPN